MRVISGNGRKMKGMKAYTIYGPTCDSTDKFPEQIMLPANLGEGDYIEFGNLGAYGRAMSSRFNGFGESEVVEVQDAPWPSLYGSVGAEVVSIGSIATR
jgi:ornithine decarboxylase